MASSVLDEEKGVDQDINSQPVDEASSSEERRKWATQSPSTPSSSSFFGRLNDKILSIQLVEKRGIERVPISERHEINTANYMQMTLLWFSTNITANNIAVGMLGPLSYDLGFTDSALCAAFGAMLGSAGAAYMSTFGPESGNRTMVSNSSMVQSIQLAWC
jgi:hypothetical protein